MVKNYGLLTGSVMVVLCAGLVGCGQGFRGTSSGSASLGSSGTNQPAAVDIDKELQKAEEASIQAQEAMAEADKAIAEITDDKGNINVSLFSKTKTSEVQSQFLLKGVMAKLTGVFDKVFARVQVVKSKFDAARNALVAALEKLDGTNPAQAALVAEIRAKLVAIDAMEGQFRNAMHMLAGKLDLAMTGIDRLVSGATSFIPGFGWVANLALDYFVMSDVKNLVAELKARLLAL
jgi:hypothetical protein